MLPSCRSRQEVQPWACPALCPALVGAMALCVQSFLPALFAASRVAASWKFLSNIPSLIIGIFKSILRTRWRDSDRIKENDFRLREGRFSSDVRWKFFTPRAVRLWHRTLGAPSLQGPVALCSLLCGSHLCPR